MSSSASLGPRNTRTLCPEEGMCVRLPKPACGFPCPEKALIDHWEEERELGGRLRLKDIEKQVSWVGGP